MEEGEESDVGKVGDRGADGVVDAVGDEGEVSEGVRRPREGVRQPVRPGIRRGDRRGRERDDATTGSEEDEERGAGGRR